MHHRARYGKRVSFPLHSKFEPQQVHDAHEKTIIGGDDYEPIDVSEDVAEKDESSYQADDKNCFS